MMTRMRNNLLITATFWAPITLSPSLGAWRLRDHPCSSPLSTSLAPHPNKPHHHHHLEAHHAQSEGKQQQTAYTTRSRKRVRVATAQSAFHIYRTIPHFTTFFSIHYQVSYPRSTNNNTFASAPQPLYPNQTNFTTMSSGGKGGKSGAESKSSSRSSKAGLQCTYLLLRLIPLLCLPTLLGHDHR